MFLRICLFLLLLPFASKGQSLPALIPITNGEKWGYADSNGKVVIPVQWEEAHFFIAGKARVMVKKEPRNTSENRYALINQKGEYIIPPAAGWNGIWNGSWGNTNLNVEDSLGKKGLMDTAGKLLIPYEWERGGNLSGALQDSFATVWNEYAGVINRQGTLVVPLKWGDIRTSADLAAVGSFEVRDPDNMVGDNSWGVANVANGLLVPPRYSRVALRYTKAGMPFFEASKAGSNQRSSNNYYNAGSASVRYLSYPDGKILNIPADQLPPQNVYEQVLTSGYILTHNNNGGQQLLDSNRKVVVEKDFWKLEGDTLFLQETARIGEDSVLLKVSFLSLPTKQPLRPDYRQIIYAEDPRPFTSYSNTPICGNSRNYNFVEPQKYTIPIPYWGESEYFYKDSLKFKVVGKSPGSKPDYIVQGNVGDRYSTFYAVVNADLEYLLEPQTAWSITQYNSGLGIAFVPRGNLHTILDTAGTVRISPQKGTIAGAFLWKGAAYALLQSKDECNPDAESKTFVINSAGIAVPAFSPFTVLPYLSRPNYYSESEQMPYEERYPPAEIWVQDSAKRLGIFRPDGTPVHLALNFKYRELKRTRNNWFLAKTEKGSRGILVDSNNKSLLPPTLDCNGVYVAQSTSVDFQIVRKYGTVSRLFSVALKAKKAGEYPIVYINDQGRLYYQAP